MAHPDVFRILEMRERADVLEACEIRGELTPDGREELERIRSQISEWDRGWTDRLDPGIRRTVRWLRSYGFVTADSGDGTSKVGEIATGEALDRPHVFMTTQRQDLVLSADALRGLLRCRLGIELEEQGEGDRDIEVLASYDPADGVPVLMLIGLDDDLLRERLGRRDNLECPDPRVSVLASALRQYGQHRYGCEWGFANPCDCGLDAALATGEAQFPTFVGEREESRDMKLYVTRDRVLGHDLDFVRLWANEPRPNQVSEQDTVIWLPTEGNPPGPRLTVAELQRSVWTDPPDALTPLVLEVTLYQPPSDPPAGE